MSQGVLTWIDEEACAQSPRGLAPKRKTSTKFSNFVVRNQFNMCFLEPHRTCKRMLTCLFCSPHHHAMHCVHIQAGQLDVVEFLLEAGANPFLKNRDRHDAWDVALHHGQPLILQALKEWVSRRTSGGASLLKKKPAGPARDVADPPAPPWRKKAKKDSRLA